MNAAQNNSQSMAAEEAVSAVMAQAQVFASAWSLVGGQFDSGTMLDEANAAKTELRGLVVGLVDGEAGGGIAAQAELARHEAATEINRLRNVIQAACLGGTELMIERWKALFPDAPVPTVKTQQAERATGAGQEPEIGHLRVLVDDLHSVLAEAMQVMKALHESAAPDDGPEMNAVIPADAFRQFVDANAELMHKRWLVCQRRQGLPVSRHGVT
ncbi:MAG: hypothetical protein K2W93_12490 [Burkholderiaceae bacterium]|nr:hypothetical protein [Burkholderiaceae bacterium]